ncbi:MAG: NAD(P)/FAD-dependent oxidoreductase [Alphaproteobacteria bacterium]
MRYDFIIIGGGIAGASAAYRLALHGSVALLEMEDQPGYHSTGRSAAQFTELYGNGPIRALVRLSKDFLVSPPEGFTDAPILTPRGAMFVATDAQRPVIDAFVAMAAEENCPVSELDVAGARGIVPVLRAEAFDSAVLEPESTDMDVHALHGGFLRGTRSRGGDIITNAEVTGLTRQDGVWRVETPAGGFEAPVVVNAAGSWADVVAERAGVGTVGLTPKRRTVILFDPPSDVAIDAWPLVIDADENWYFKPDAGKVLASPADETPVEASDAQPEELDIALIADAIERMTTMRVGRISHSRAGLRTFASDKTPVVGFAPDAEGFFWLAGQGGYGIETSPAMGVATASLIVDGNLPSEFLEAGVSEADLTPRRFV